MVKAGSRVLHVVVGAGIIPHFRNAIESILNVTNDEVLAIYNAISPRDFESFTYFKSTVQYGSRVDFQVFWNEGPSKTGSLYDAYNLAIDIAQSTDIENLNLVQSDCQLMWWSDGLVRSLDKIFTATDAVDRQKVLCVGTVFPVFGKFVGSRLEDRITFDPNLGSFVNDSAGLEDVGIFSMSAIRAVGFRFVDTEAELQERYSNRGYVVPLLDVPCVAFIPWPASVRKGKVVGTVVEPFPSGTPLLKLVDGMNPHQTEATWKTKPFWMEDWVKPNGWDCLYPYWPTSIENPKWFRRRIEASRLLGVSLLEKASSYFPEGNQDAILGKPVPATASITLALGLGYSRILIDYLRRLMRSVAKRLTPAKE